MQYILNEAEYEAEYKKLGGKADRLDKIGDTFGFVSMQEPISIQKEKEIVLKIPAKKQVTIELNIETVFAAFDVDFKFYNITSVKLEEGKLILNIE